MNQNIPNPGLVAGLRLLAPDTLRLVLNSLNSQTIRDFARTNLTEDDPFYQTLCQLALPRRLGLTRADVWTHEDRDVVLLGAPVTTIEPRRATRSNAAPPTSVNYKKVLTIQRALAGACHHNPGPVDDAQFLFWAPDVTACNRCTMDRDIRIPGRNCCQAAQAPYPHFDAWIGGNIARLREVYYQAAKFLRSLVDDGDRVWDVEDVNREMVHLLAFQVPIIQRFLGQCTCWPGDTYEYPFLEFEAIFAVRSRYADVVSRNIIHAAINDLPYDTRLPAAEKAALEDLFDSARTEDLLVQAIGTANAYLMKKSLLSRPMPETPHKDWSLRNQQAHKDLFKRLKMQYADRREYLKNVQNRMKRGRRITAAMNRRFKTQMDNFDRRVENRVRAQWIEMVLQSCRRCPICQTDFWDQDLDVAPGDSARMSYNMSTGIGRLLTHVQDEHIVDFIYGLTKVEILL